MKEKLGKAGYIQGDMAPKVEDFEAPAGDFGEHSFSKTLDYVERQDAFRKKEAAGLKKQDYKGRYS